jgi:hypothetical protein
MIRSIVLAASAVALFAAAPAGAAEIRIKTAGKAPAELRAEIVKAASTVCWQNVRGETLATYLYPSCDRFARLVRGGGVPALSVSRMQEALPGDGEGFFVRAFGPEARPSSRAATAGSAALRRPSGRRPC